MGGFGSFNPFPMVFGTAAATDLEAIQNGLVTLHGSALAKEKGSILWLENHATACVLYDLYRLTQRFANQWDPPRMTVFLERWEKILGLRPLSGESLIERRERVEQRFALIGANTDPSTVNDLLAESLGPMFVELVFTDPLDAITYVPGGGSVPGGGPTFLDGNLLPSDMSPWASSVAYVAIMLEKPPTMSDAEFYERAGRVYDDIDNRIGAWMSFAWVRDGVNGPGFYLDEDNNLDNQRFD